MKRYVAIFALMLSGCALFDGASASQTAGTTGKEANCQNDARVASRACLASPDATTRNCDQDALTAYKSCKTREGI